MIKTLIATRLTRRALLSSVLSLVFLKPAGAGRHHDRGIGGTGSFAYQAPEDRGISGTGVIGTIREFGSIIVNEMHISYPENATVVIDGQEASLAELRLGHIAVVVADETGGAFSTQRITITNEVVGPIEAVSKGSLTVLGQKVLTTHIGDVGWRTGDWIAVSGLRNFDGAIVASLAQYSDGSNARVAGPVRLSPAGVPQIGGLTISNLDPSLVGRRVLTEVGRSDGTNKATKTVVDPELAAMPNVRNLSVESYVVHSAAGTHFGSGIVVSSTSGPGVGAQNTGATAYAASAGATAGSTAVDTTTTKSVRAIAAVADVPTKSAVRAVVAVSVDSVGKMTVISQKPAPAPKPAQPNLKPPAPKSAPVSKTKANATSAKPVENKPATKAAAQPAAKAADVKPTAKAAVQPATKAADVKPVQTAAPQPVRAPPPPPPHIDPPHIVVPEAHHK